MAKEISIISEMVEAGMREYSSRWLGLRDADDEVAKEMVQAVFCAMLRSRRRPDRGDYRNTRKDFR